MHDLAAHMLPLRPGASSEARIKRSEKMLLHALSKNSLVAVAGSGCSLAFGYPNWTRFAKGVIERTLEALPVGHPSRRCVEEFDRSLNGEIEQQNDVLMYFIGTCQQVLKDLDDPEGRNQNRYKQYIEETFKPSAGRLGAGEADPYDALVDLPIQRFVTTNYDCEIEKALARKRGVSRRELGLARGGNPGETVRCRSLTQKDHAELARFTLADIPGNEDMVFHCHGRYDAVDTIIASEADYQSWYLADAHGLGLPFQYSFELLLTYNPLLFVGYSMRDEDLMRNLRLMGALDPARKDAKPLFALVENREQDRHYHESLFERYGVHVIPYDVPEGPVRDRERTAALCDTLIALRELHEKELQRRFCKPRVRKPLVATHKPNPHIEMPALARVPGGRSEQLDAAASRPGLVELIGPSGSGKSMALWRLLEDIRETHPDLEGSFYWSAHYGNEFLTAADHALSYFDPGGKVGGSRFERIRRCLFEHRFLLILDGCERLLRPANPPSTGRSYSAAFRRLLGIFTDPGSCSTVVLASRLRFGDLDAIPAARRTRCQVCFVPLKVDDLAKSPSRLERAADLPGALAALLDRPGDSTRVRLAVSALCSLLQGHSYGLQLASTFLATRRDKVRELERLNTRLAARPPDQRLREMIQALVSMLDGVAPHHQPHAALLERLSLFLSPLCVETIEVCRQQAKRVAKNAQEHLLGHELLICSGQDQKTYAVHATVRKELLHPQQESAADALPSFGLSSFTSGRVGVGPGACSIPLIRSIFDKLMEEACRKSLPKKKRRDLCRDAFGLVRTCMDANTAARWSRLDEYTRFGLRIALLAEDVSSDSWSYLEHQDSALIEDREGSLYIGELAWLYADLGLAFSSEGSLEEASRLFEHAYEISRVIEGADGGGYQIETLLNLVLVFIEKGRLPAARRYLGVAASLSARLGDDDYSARILGFRALLEHLFSNLQRADELYEECLAVLGTGTNLRAKSFFSRCRADLKLYLREGEAAALLALTGRAIAEAGAFPDLVAYARLSGARALAMTNELTEARREYDAVLREAQQLGLRKLESKVQGALAEISLAQGDREGAHAFAMKSLGLANQLGYCLQLTRSLILTGQVTVAIEQRDLGVAYLRLAKELADEQEYWYCSGQAERELQRLGESIAGGAAPGRAPGRRS